MSCPFFLVPSLLQPRQGMGVQHQPNGCPASFINQKVLLRKYHVRKQLLF
jgi:hypothetical protein